MKTRHVNVLTTIQDIEPMTEPKTNKRNRRQARENTREQDVIGFVLKLIGHWLNMFSRVEHVVIF